jgi:hypothetical protein
MNNPRFALLCKKCSPCRNLARPLPLLLLAGVAACGRNGTLPPESHSRDPAVPARAASPVAEKSEGPPPAFRDITEQAGIRFRHQNSKTPQKYMIETMGSGCALLDYDQDGRLDVLLVNNRLLPGGRVEGKPTLTLYHNDGNEGNDANVRFSDRTRDTGLDRDSLYGMGVAVGDYDNDGWPDVYVSCVLGSGKLYHNEGGRRFADVTSRAGVGNAGRWGTSCAWVDYDRDGKLDLFVCNYVKFATLADDQPCYAGVSKTRTYCIPVAYENSNCVLYHNEGGGKFRDVSEESGVAAASGKSLGVTIWDYDGDGWPDIFVANDTTAGFLFHNEKNGKFTEIGAESGIAYDENGSSHSGMGIDAADARNDGRTAVVITNYYGQQTCYYVQTDSASFRDDRQPSLIGPQTVNSLGFGLCFLDYDNDGWQDVLQVNGHVQDDIQTREPKTPYAEPSLLLRNDGNGTFTEVGLKAGKPFTDPLVARGLARGDFDNDGRVDALIACNNSPARLWRNETTPSGHWLTLKLVGTKSNRDGIGAVVVVRTVGMIQTRMARTACSYLSSSDPRPHFGLGTASKADVEVHWPSGTVDRVTDMGADHVWTIREGEGKAQ